MNLDNFYNFFAQFSSESVHIDQTYEASIARAHRHLPEETSRLLHVSVLLTSDSGGPSKTLSHIICWHL